MDKVELSILVARPDAPFMLHTIPHLVKACNYPFIRRSLILDHAPLNRSFVNRPNIGDLSQLRDCCDKLLKSGIVDEVIDIDYSETRRAQIYNKHFGSDIKHTHDGRGSSIYGFIFSIEEAQADYVVHFDSDMLLCQQAGFDWIDCGIKLLWRRPEIMIVNPLPGPPIDDGTLYQLAPYQYDSQGFYRFQCFSSRVFLIDKQRFDLLLPLPLELTADGKLSKWEDLITTNLRDRSYIRADIGLSNAWTLHPNDHSSDFVSCLPKIVERVEAGWYPDEQAGHYDLKLGAWMRQLGIERKHARAYSVEQVIEDHILKSLRSRPDSDLLNGAYLKLNVFGDGGGEWVFDLSQSCPLVTDKKVLADCTISISANDLIDIFNNELFLSVAIEHGWLRIDGDIHLFQHFTRLLR